jgi:serine/threonine protein kinase/HAMP domain-containing protein
MGHAMDNSEAIDKRDEAEQSSALLRVPILERQIAALEKVVVMERNLRKLQAARIGSAPLPSPSPAPPGFASFPQSDDVTILSRPISRIADPDVTILSRPPFDDSTVLYRAGAPVQSHQAAAQTQPHREADSGSALVLATGFQLFEYRIDAVLGQGGFGITYLATDVHLNVKVAIKEYLPAGVAQRSSDKSVGPRWPEDGVVYQAGLDRFLVEARTLATFRHPNIVRVARFFEANRTAYMVLEYERGKSLKQWWPSRKRIGEADLLNLLGPLLDGLAVVHGAGFLHRDIKPDNIYVRKEDGSLVLLDFGAARQAVGQGGAMADVITPGYAPPEQYDNGAQGPWTDIYSLGATLYWMITGSKPPDAPARASGECQMPPAQEVGKGKFSDAFLGAVDCALNVDPAARPQDLRAFSQQLFASHAGSLALSEALNAGETPSTHAGFGNESLRALLDSPRLLRRRAHQLLCALVHPASWPMVVKMTGALVFAALLPMLITGYYNLNGSVQAVSAGELRNLKRMADSTAGRVSQLITDNENLAKFLATEEGLIDYLKHPDDAHKQIADLKIGVLVRTNPGLQLITLLDAEGRALISSEPGIVGLEYSSREYFRQAARGRPFQTGIIMGSLAGERGMVYAHPIIDEDNEVVGVLVLRIEAASFGAILDAATRGTGRVPIMIDGDGVVIHYPDPAKLNHSLDELSADVQQRIAADQRFRIPHVDSLGMPVLARTLVRATQAGSLSYKSTLSGSEEHAGYAPVAGQSWVVALTESRETFEAPLQKLFSNVLYSVALVGLLFMAIAVVFARSIVRPIARLMQAATALKEGKYERATVVVTTNDEIGQLARTFNVMIDVLRQRERERGRAGHGRGTQRAAPNEQDGNDAA